jgi:hypothetical protein
LHLGFNHDGILPSVALNSTQNLPNLTTGAGCAWVW